MYCKGCKYLPLGSQECYSCSAGSNYVPNELESLKKENAELSNSVTELTNTKTELKTKVTELKKQIEEMKCCGNCNGPCWVPPIVRKSECLNNNYSLWEMLK